jgi:molybdate transport system permease protein
LLPTLDVAALWPPVRLSLLLATSTTLILLVMTTPLAWWLARSRHPVKEAVSALVTMPLVLPPTVLGFYLLIALGPNGPGGWVAGLWGARTLAFSFEGLLIGSLIYSLPFAVQPLRQAYEAIGDEPLEAAATLGASSIQRFFRVALPLARPGYLAGGILAFAHTVGEFGVVLMIGGNVPGETKVISIAIYDFVERLQWNRAHLLAAGLVLFSFLVVLATNILSRRFARPTALL